MTDKSKIKKELDLFINQCYWAYECWQMYKEMQVYKDLITDQTSTWYRLGVILHEYSLSQIAKINDPSETLGYQNLSLQHIVETVKKCSVGIEKDYQKFCEDNTEIIEAIKQARDKVLSHHDLQLADSGTFVGIFTYGKDTDYFNSLHYIITKIYDDLGLGIFPEWPVFVTRDTEEFMRKLRFVFS